MKIDNWRMLETAGYAPNALVPPGENPKCALCGHRALDRRGSVLCPICKEKHIVYHQMNPDWIIQSRPDRDGNGCEQSAGQVLVHNAVLPVQPSLSLHEHARDGFGWGYAGSGPAQLAPLC